MDEAQNDGEQGEEEIYIDCSAYSRFDSELLHHLAQLRVGQPQPDAAKRINKHDQPPILECRVLHSHFAPDQTSQATSYFAAQSSLCQGHSRGDGCLVTE